MELSYVGIAVVILFVIYFVSTRGFGLRSVSEGLLSGLGVVLVISLLVGFAIYSLIMSLLESGAQPVPPQPHHNGKHNESMHSQLAGYYQSLHDSPSFYL